MKLKLLGAGVMVALAGCQSDDGVAIAEPDPAKATLSGEACPDVGEAAYFFWMSPVSAEPGQKIGLSPYWTDMPGGFNPLPAGCVDDVSAHPDGAVILTRTDNGLALAEIAEGAEAGTRIHLTATYNGHGLIGLVDVYRAADNPLVGRWRQDSGSCAPGSAVQELVFTGSGDFSVTWTPFEAYKDYWGSYTYDADTGAVSFEIESGNQTPEDVVLEGAAQVSGDELSFDGVSFGTPRNAESACRGKFLR
ncbi:hypothetical protein [Hyphomonas atlantica]|uniref:hypothetical protein n=1 Tax=Hyphomonas atlantica TaxID=1280948 RepID=UPI0032B1798F